METRTNTSNEPKLIAEGRLPVTKMIASLPTPERKASISFTIEEVHKRAETISPLLKELLGFRPPPHWGINE